MKGKMTIIIRNISKEGIVTRERSWDIKRNDDQWVVLHMIGEIIGAIKSFFA